jgi:hypothetical protein
MSKLKIAIYVRTSHFRRNSVKNPANYNLYQWIGVELIKDVLLRQGYEVEYCSSATVHEYDIILVSMVSISDWYGFIRERKAWKEGKYTVIVGGPGAANPRAVLKHADVFVFGRGENLIVPLIEFVRKNDRLYNESICYSDEFSMGKRYKYAQSDIVYPHTITLPKGKGNTFVERGLGCQRKCLFCHYSWTRGHIGTKHFKMFGGKNRYANNQEFTMFDINYDDPNSLGSMFINVGLDGLSSRLRKIVNKPISKELLKKFIIFGSKTYRRIKLYNIINYAWETDDDYLEFMEAFYEAESEIGSGSKYGNFHVVDNPFLPMPTTPTATWPTKYFDPTLEDLKLFKKITRRPISTRLGIYTCDKFNVAMKNATRSLAAVAMDLLIIRGKEEHAELIDLLATSPKFGNANRRVKLKTLENLIDIEQFFKEVPLESLATRNIDGIVPIEKAIKTGETFRKKGGVL